MTVSQDEYHQRPGTAPPDLNTAFILVVSSPSAFPAIRCQNVCCEKAHRQNRCPNLQKLDPSCNIVAKHPLKHPLKHLTDIIPPEKHQHFLFWVYNQFYQPALKMEVSLDINKKKKKNL